ncbi:MULTISPECIES: hypothetical protein [unclassified Amycolatopsis]|uniref:hypothetical protein n=1 Tax=unclassified Amycolatopsis TaxID=2618356 RepID=UPI001C69A4D7|nr:hypothetical protein [Amycolatopsis sp. DSM 110486]QYN19212.1 hypothetical protein K1T34_42300 [Amycolatopsis sp. DSM 110486]
MAGSVAARRLARAAWVTRNGQGRNPGNTTAGHYLAFLTIAASITCYKKLTK